jgi:hypothetical protein
VEYVQLPRKEVGLIGRLLTGCIRPAPWLRDRDPLISTLEILAMKKSLLALAVLSAFAGAASAQSSVTLSGGVDVSIERQNGAWNMGAGNSGRSNFTLSGTEDLGGGMRAFFVLNNRASRGSDWVAPSAKSASVACCRCCRSTTATSIRSAPRRSAARTPAA